MVQNTIHDSVDGEAIGGVIRQVDQKHPATEEAKPTPVKKASAPVPPPPLMLVIPLAGANQSRAAKRSALEGAPDYCWSILQAYRYVQVNSESE